MKFLYENSIFINKIPQSVTIENIVEFCSRYDEIVKYQVGRNRNSIIIEFKDHGIVQDLLSQQLYYNDKRLDVHKAVSLYEKGKCSKNISYDDLRTVINPNSTFDSQLTAFLKKIELSDKENTTVYEPICRQLENVLQSKFPKCKVYRFGSSITDLAFKNSDLDIYLYTGLPVSEKKGSSSGPHVLCSESLLPIVEGTLKSNQHLYSRCISLPQASTPIIKFIHRATNINCDVSFKNKLGIYNSELLKFYLSINPNFRPVMMIIKYWIYSCQLRSSIEINNYAMTLLFIFYLQQLKLVPTVIDLKNKCSIPLVISGWQVNFNRTDIDSKIDCNSNAKNIPLLLQEFFEFYASYDFESYIICLNDGKSYDKKLFESADNLPSTMMRYKEYIRNTADPIIFISNMPMCVQDPNQLNWNVTKKMSLNHVNRFQIFCAISANIVQSSLENNYRTLLQDIFNFNNTQTTLKEIQDSKDCITFPIHLDNIVITKGIISTKQKDWFYLIINIVGLYLSRILGLHIQICNNEKNLNEKNLGIQQNSFRLNCKSVNNSWNKKELQKVSDFSKSLPEMKIPESKGQKSKEMDEKNKTLELIDFQCRLTRRIEPKIHVLVTVLNNNNCEMTIFSEIANNLILKLPAFIENSINKINKEMKE